MAQLRTSNEESKLLSIRRVIENFPWDLLPSEKELPTADMGTKKTTTFLDSTILRRVSVELRAYRDELLSLDAMFDLTIGEQLLKMPRISMLLKMLGLQEHLSSFMEAEKTDGLLPLQLATVEELVGLDNAKLFELEQYRTTLRDFHVDKPNIYREKQPVPVRTIRSLGHGGWAQVDWVENVITGAQLARKRFSLKRALAKRLKQSFETEVASLQKLNGHQHIIQYLYSYETEQSLNLLLSPVADCNLHEYLSTDDYELGNRNDILVRSFGCLASALAFMHQHNIRHKDVKSQNILLYQRDGTTRVVFTDFGISFDFSSRDNSVTDGATHKTRKYCAPEVARDSPRGRKSDVYSLGCIYLEILTVLVGKSVDDLDDFLGSDANYYESQEEMHAWIHQLSQEADETISLVLEWCSAMIQRKALDRPYIDETIDQISFQTKGRNQRRRRLFCDICLSELRIRNLITAEGVGDEGSESEGTDYEDDDKQWDDNADSQNLEPKSLPLYALQEPIEKRLTDSRGYRTISVHVVYTTKLFESCVSAFHSITKSLRSSSSLPMESEVALIRFEMEYLRLINWSSVVGLSGSRQLSNDLLHNHHAILNVLLQQQTLLENCWNNPRRRGSLDLVQPELGVASPKLPSSALSVISSIPPLGKAEELASRKLISPPNLTMGELDSLINHLATKNDDPIALLSENGKEDILAKDEETNTQILQLYNTFDDLVALVTAIWPSAVPLNPRKEWPLPDDTTRLGATKDGTRFGAPTRESLAQYARLKAINSFDEYGMQKYMIQESDPYLFRESESENLHGSHKPTAVLPSIILDLPDIATTKALSTAMDVDPGAQFAQDPSVSLMMNRHAIKVLGDDFDERHRVSARLSHSGARPQDVWIEWKEYEPVGLTGYPDPKVLQRITALASLLHDRQRPKDLRVPRCLGFFKDDDYCRFGLVFERPESTESPHPPVSLLQLLHDMKVQPPPLGTRIGLARSIAEAVERLHAVNWLHKGLRSDNVVFFQECTDTEAFELRSETSGDTMATLRWSLPYISGFDYSRPANSDDMTERPPENAQHDIYRHPRIQGSRYREDTPYKRSYDFYSLGVILLEIAEWRSIDHILGIADVQNIRPSVSIKVRSRLLREPDIREHVRFSCGVKFADSIWACLGGIEAFGLDAASDESEVLVGVELQQAYYNQVVRTLTELARAL